MPHLNKLLSVVRIGYCDALPDYVRDQIDTQPAGVIPCQPEELHRKSYPRGRLTVIVGDSMDHSDKEKTKHIEIEQPIPSRIYPVIGTNFTRDNIENNISAADLEDLREIPHPDSRRIDG